MLIDQRAIGYDEGQENILAKVRAHIDARRTVIDSERPNGSTMSRYGQRRELQALEHLLWPKEPILLSANASPTTERGKVGQKMSVVPVYNDNFRP